MYVGVGVSALDHAGAESSSAAFSRTWYDERMENVFYTVKVHPAAEGGYWAEVPALEGCFSQGDSLEEVTTKVRAAMESQLSSLVRDGLPFPVEKRTGKAFNIPVSVRVPRSA